MANLEIKRICGELQTLAGARISKIYGIGGEDFRFIFSTKDGAKELFVRLGVCLHLTRFVREAPQEPTQLAMLLRKHVENSRVVSVYQNSGDRVVVFELEKEKKYRLIFEMFAKGNLVLVGDEGKAVACRRTEEWRDRKTKIGEKYAFPASSPSTPVEAMGAITGEKGKLMAVLAKKVPIGAIYLEEACARAGLPVNTTTGALSANQLAKLAASIGEVISENSPRVYYEKDGSRPREYALSSLSKFEKMETASLEKKEFDSLSSALDEFAAEPALPAGDEKKKAEIGKIARKLEEQEKKAVESGQEADEAKSIGDAIYANYGKIEGLLNEIRDLRKSGANWDEVREKTGAKIDDKKGKAKIIL